MRRESLSELGEHFWEFALNVLEPYLLYEDVRENALRVIMWGGAVNRQPGYRARNLQRRGF